MKKAIFNPVFFGFAVVLGLFVLTSTDDSAPIDGALIVRKCRRAYNRFFHPRSTLPQGNFAAMSQTIATENKAMENNLKRSKHLAAQFETSADKRTGHYLGVTVFNAPKLPRVAMHRIKVFIDEKEFFRSAGGVGLGIPGTFSFRCAIPRSSSPRSHTIRVLDSATDETVVLHEIF